MLWHAAESGDVTTSTSAWWWKRFLFRMILIASIWFVL
jgi:hypothetical protein